MRVRVCYIKQQNSSILVRLSLLFVQALSFPGQTKIALLTYLIDTSSLILIVDDI